MAIAPTNALLNPNATLSGPALMQAAQALAKSQTQPVIQQLNQDIGQANQHTTAAENLANQYFTQLGQQAQSGVNQTEGIQSGLNSQLQGLQGDENSQLQGIGQGAMNTLNTYSPGGAGVGASAIAGEIARQQGLAAQQSGAMRAFGATQGANFSSNAASNLGSFAARGQEDLSQIGQAGAKTVQPLTQKLAQERATYGSDLVTALGKLRQQEITNEQTNAGLGIKQQTAATTAANDAANQKINAGKLGVSQQNANTTAKNAGTTAQNDAANQALKAQGLQITQQNDAANQALKQEALNEKTGAGGGTPLTPNENNTWLGKLDKITAAIQTWQQGGMKNSKGVVSVAHPTNAQMKQVLAGGGYTDTQIQAAFELLGWGHITPQTAAQMHSGGVRGGSFRGAPIKVAPAPTNKLGGAAPGPLTTPVAGIGNTIANTLSNIGG